MQRAKDADSVFSEIDDLYNFVRYGSQRVDDFIEQVNRLESSYCSLTSRTNVDRFIRRCRSVDNFIQATGDSIKDWKTKAGTYLVFIYEVGQDVSLQQDATMGGMSNVEEKIHSLIAMLREQNNLILYLRDKLRALNDRVVEKQSTLQRKIRRGRAPKLISAERKVLA